MLEEKIRKHLPDIVEAIIEIMGEEYRGMINRRIENTNIIPYYNLDNLVAYYDILLNNKRRQLAQKFFESININTGDFDSSNLFNKVSPEFENAVKIFFGNIKNIFPTQTYKKHPGLLSFVQTETNKSHTPDSILKIITQKFQREFLNGIKKMNLPDFQISKDNLSPSSKEFKQAKLKIDDYQNVYNEVKKEFEEYKLENTEIMQKIVAVKKISDKINNQKALELYKTLETGNHLPEFITSRLSTLCKTDEEKSQLLFPEGILKKTCLEFCDEASTIALEYDFISQKRSDLIIKNRLQLADNLQLCTESEEPEEEFEKLLNTNRKSLNALYDIIKGARDLLIQSYSNEFLSKTTNIDDLNYDEDYRNNMANAVSQNKVCYLLNFNGKQSIVFTIKKSEAGQLDFVFIHELIHACENSFLHVGFDSHYYDDRIVDESTYDNEDYDNLDLDPELEDILNKQLTNNREYINEKNPFREYEKLNETFTDVLAIKVLENLRKKDIYIFEPKSVASKQIFHENSSSVQKEMIAPMLDNHFNEVINARMNGDKKILFEVLSESTFEKINSNINKVFTLQNKLKISVNEQAKTKIKERINDLKQETLSLYNDPKMEL